ncbi:MAG TPA: DinB family protein [Cyclobacteriaceae bacterium]
MDDLVKLFKKDFQKLRTEIGSFHADAALWKTSGDIINSAGNIVLHLCGNMRHFIGATLGNTGYEREREKEFTMTGLTKEQLIEAVNITEGEVLKALDNLSEKQLNDKYPLEPFGYPVTHQYFLIHIYAHFNYHLGQINYLRRLLS